MEAIQPLSQQQTKEQTEACKHLLVISNELLSGLPVYRQASLGMRSRTGDRYHSCQTSLSAEHICIRNEDRKQLNNPKIHLNKHVFETYSWALKRSATWWPHEECKYRPVPF